jgi:hypothetical protein
MAELATPAVLQVLRSLLKEQTAKIGKKLIFQPLSFTFFVHRSFNEGGFPFTFVFCLLFSQEAPLSQSQYLQHRKILFY